MIWSPLIPVTTPFFLVVGGGYHPQPLYFVQRTLAMSSSSDSSASTGAASTGSATSPPRSRWPWRVLRSARPRGRPVRRPRPDLARDNPPRIQWFIGESEPETVEFPWFSLDICVFFLNIFPDKQLMDVLETKLSKQNGNIPVPSNGVEALWPFRACDQSKGLAG